MNEALIKELKRIFSDREMAEKISKLNEDEIFDFCLKNSGLEFTDEDFRAAVVDLLCMSDVGRRFLSEEELDLIAGGVGGNLKKSAATLMSLLTLSGASPSFAADSGSAPSGTTASVSLEVAWENFENLKKVDINGVEYVVLGEDLGENGEITQDYIWNKFREYYYSFSNVKIADNVTKIGGGAFQYCFSLKRVDAAKVEEVGEWAYNEAVNLEELNLPEVKKIGFSAFSKCEKLKRVNSPKVEEIGGDAFSWCKSLKSVSFPRVKEIEDGVFGDCESLEEVNLPEVKKIDFDAFWVCNKLKKVNAPKVEEIGGLAFSYCTSLEEINLLEVKKIGSGAFWGCVKLKKINAPKVEEIGNEAFRNCKSLEEVNLPEAKKISSGAFEECTNLKNVKIPKLEFEDDDVGYYSTLMEACDNLQEVTVPNLKSFKFFSSWPCDNLKKIFLPKSAAQDNIDPASVGVPEGCEIVYLD